MIETFTKRPLMLLGLIELEPKQSTSGLLTERERLDLLKTGVVRRKKHKYTLTFREAFNFLVQGFSADMIRIAAIKCLNVIKRNPTWGLKMIFTVHDEIGFKVKEEYAWVAGKAIKKAFETAVRLKVPVKADITMGDNYAEAK